MPRWLCRRWPCSGRSSPSGSSRSCAKEKRSVENNFGPSSWASNHQRAPCSFFRQRAGNTSASSFAGQHSRGGVSLQEAACPGPVVAPPRHQPPLQQVLVVRIARRPNRPPVGLPHNSTSNREGAVKKIMRRTVEEWRNSDLESFALRVDVDGEHVRLLRRAVPRHLDTKQRYGSDEKNR